MQFCKHSSPSIQLETEGELNTSNANEGKQGIFNNVSAVDLKDLAVASLTSKKRVWVVKATSSRTVAPKEKYVRRISNEIWKMRDISDFIVYFRARPVFSNPVICLKTLISLHIILQDCPTEVMRQIRDRISLIVDIRDVWASEKHAKGNNY